MVTLLNASGGKIELSTCTTAPLEMGGQRALQQLWIVKELVCPVILGTNFMEKHAVEIDFKQKQVKVQDNVITAQEEPVTNERCTVHNGHTTWENHYSATMTLPDTEETDECAIPDFGSKADIVLPTCSTEFQPIVEEFKDDREKQKLLNTLFQLLSPPNQSAFLHVAFQPTTNLKFLVRSMKCSNRV